MRISLHEIVNIPGKSIPFSYDLDLSYLAFDSVKKIESPSHVSGEIRNTAGVLELNGVVQVDMQCVCARCLGEFGKHIDMQINVTLAEELQDEDNPDIFLLDGDYIDVDEVVYDAFVLNMEQKILCREDCKGLCDKCGKNLNDGPCSCKTEIDPRLAVLGQFLENE